MTALREVDHQPPIYPFELSDLLCLPLASATPQALNEETIKRLERSITLGEKLLSESPTILESQALLGMALRRMAPVQQLAKKIEQAASGDHRAIEIQHPLAARYPSTSVYQVAYVKSLSGLAELD